MTQTITIDGVSRGDRIDRKTIEIAESAYFLEVAAGKMEYLDDVGNVSIVGHKTITVDQDASTPARIGTAFVGPKSIRTRANPYGAGRRIEFATRDLNALVARLVIHGSGAAGGSRPAESITARVNYLLSTWLNQVGVFDFGRVQTSSLGVDKKKLQGSKAGDELNAMARAAEFNTYIRFNADEDAYELVFRNENETDDDTWLALTDSCSVRISNDVGEAASDIGVTVFRPLDDETDFEEDPDEVFSDVYASYRKGHVFESRPATATAFVERHATTDDSSDEKEATARRNARTYLHNSSTEEQAIDLAIRVKEDQVNLFPAGFRVQTKMVHLTPEGWASGDGRWARIARRRILQPLGTDEDYNLKLHLLPEEAARPATGMIQSAFGRGFNNGLTLELPNLVTIGNELVVFISTKLDPDPQAPNIDEALPHIGGTDPWNRFNGSTKTAAYAANYGLSAYYKTATATDNIARIQEQIPAVAIYELAGSDCASATIVDQDESTQGPNYDIGTQTPAAGDIALAAWNLGPLPAPATYEWSSAPAAPVGTPVKAYQTLDPNPSVSAGWTLDYSKWNSDGSFLGYVQPSSPWTVFAHALGDGNALLARVTPGESGHQFGALYIVIPPA